MVATLCFTKGSATCHANVGSSLFCAWHDVAQVCRLRLPPFDILCLVWTGVVGRGERDERAGQTMPWCLAGLSGLAN